MSRRFVINGVEYDSVEAMPPEVRELLAQALADASKGAPGPGTESGTENDPAAPPTRVVHEQLEVTAVEGLPPEFFLRAASSTDPKKHPVYRTVLQWGYGFAGGLALLIALFIFFFR